MSTTGIEAVLARAMSDTAFAEQLFTNPEQALAGFELTAEEVVNLKAMSRAEFEKFSKTSPEDRKSMGGIWNPGNHNETTTLPIQMEK